MHYKSGRLAFVIISLMLSLFKVTAQISPGDLSTAHAHLEGMSNCTQCHVLGNKVSSEKCLTCHAEVKERIGLQKGYHSSAYIKGKDCFVCHSDHHGKNFQLIRFDLEKFDHNLTGYSLSAPHARKECKDCHNTKYIADAKIKAKKYTFMGVSTDCLNCHSDYHMKTLSTNCLNCHNPDTFKTASKFSHNSAKFKLVGKHINVDCLKCHKIDIIDGNKFQEFKGLQFSNCTGCHKDKHQNKYGQNCRQCHSEESFKIVTGLNKFDHNKTDYRLEGKHIAVNCKACHKTAFTDPLKYKRCSDCHTDYHKKQFVKNGVSPDCSQCHDIKGFTSFSYTIDQHNLSPFPIQGSHLAIPCFDCHRKQKTWNFRGIGFECKDCHKDIHQALIPAKYYPEANCKICHNESRWASISFNHSSTEFELTGAHLKQDCRACHAAKDTDGIVPKKFSDLSQNCSSCHTDKHYKQFEKNGITNCSECHSTENWKASAFDHTKAAFVLDGKHTNVACIKCHKPQKEGLSFYIKYKLNVFTCESCHS